MFHAPRFLWGVKYLLSGCVVQSFYSMPSNTVQWFASVTLLCSYQSRLLCPIVASVINQFPVIVGEAKSSMGQAVHLQATLEKLSPDGFQMLMIMNTQSLSTLYDDSVSLQRLVNASHPYTELVRPRVRRSTLLSRLN